MKKRLFFGFDVKSTWIEKDFPGKIIPMDQRHITLAYLGDSDFSLLETKLESLCLPSFLVGKTGYFDKCLFLPEKQPHAVAYHVQWLDGEEVAGYQKSLVQMLNKNGFWVMNGTKQFLPHVTVCRHPKNTQSWEKAFRKLPMMFTRLHLYESLGNSQYKSLWNRSFYPPFEEIDHTGDLAFLVHGASFTEIFANAQIALAFEYSYMLDFYMKKNCSSIEEVMINLNELIRQVDIHRSCPFKAVSLHGKVEKDERDLLHWEMIVDV